MAREFVDRTALAWQGIGAVGEMEIKILCVQAEFVNEQ